MFSINLRDIDLSPKLEEDRLFENEDSSKLSQEVVRYIQQQTPDINQFTVMRKVDEAIKDADGKTQADRKVETAQNAVEQDATRKAKRQEVDAQVTQEFEPKRSEYKQWVKAEEDRINNDYAPRIAVSKDTSEKATLTEEMRLKLDDLTLQRSKREKTLFEDEQARKKELLGG